MSQHECRFEADVLEAVMQSRWPLRVDSELREHAMACSICSDVAAVASAIEVAREEQQIPVLPNSGLVWWKAQMRARREALEAVQRPITAVHLAACVVFAGVIGACLGATSGTFQSALTWLGQKLNPAVVLPYLTAMIQSHALLAACLAGVAILTPVALYWAISRD